MIRFMYNGLKTEDGILHKAWYSGGKLNGYPDETITIYARRYGRALPRIDGLDIENASDCQSDYYEADHIRVTPDNPWYPAVLAAYQSQEAKRAKRYGGVA